MSTSDLSSIPDQSATQSEKAVCPYPDCEGILTGLSYCPTCRRPVTKCPNGHIMATDLAFCDTCGYDAKKESQRSIKFVISQEVSVRIIADAYRDAALANTNMRSATELLESLRVVLADGTDYHKTWDKLDENIGRTLDRRLRHVLLTLRENFVAHVTDGEIARLQAGFASDPNGTWSEWLRTYAAAVNNGRMVFAKRLCESSFLFPTNALIVIKKIRRSSELIIQERWSEVLGMFCYLSTLGCIGDLDRAKLLVIAGEIELYHLKRIEKAKKLFDEAIKIAPLEGRVLFGMSEYYLQQNQIPKARQLANQVVSLIPLSSQGCVLQGDCNEAEGDLDAAEENFQEAISTAPGETNAYFRLLSLYGRPERFDAFESRSAPLRETVALIEPLNEYSLAQESGVAYQQNGKYDEAHSWYDQAIASDRDRLGAYISKGYAYLEQENHTQAQLMFEKAILVAPEAIDGYWGMYYLHDQLGQSQDATEVYEKYLTRQAAMFMAIADFEKEGRQAPQNIAEATDELLNILRKEPENESLLNSLTTLADLYYRNSAGLTAALELYAKIREAKGESYEPYYQNLVGNAKYYSEDYAEAAKAYQAAIDSGSVQPIYYSNLSLAYQGLKQWDKARQALDEALKLDKLQDKHREQTAAVWNLEGNSYFEQSNYLEAGECYKKAIELQPNVDVYHSNLSLSWENLKPSTGQLEALRNATDALKKARELSPEDESYKNRMKSLEARFQLAATHGEHVINKSPLVTPLAVEVAKDLIPYIEASEGGLTEEVTRLILDLRNRIAETFALRVPSIRFRGNETDLPAGSYIIMLMEVPIVMMSISLNDRLFPGSEEKLKEIGVIGVPATYPGSVDQAFWVDEEDTDKIKAAGLEVFELTEYPIRHLEAVIRQNLADFIDHQEVTNLLTASTTPACLEVKNSPEKLTALTNVLRALVSEQVPIVPIDGICSSFLDSLKAGTDLTTVVENARSLPYIRPNLPGNNAKFSFYRMGSKFAVEFASSVHVDRQYRYLAMAPEKCQESLAAVRKALGSAESNNVALVVDQAELRPLLRRMTELEFPNTPVLSKSELLTEFEDKIVGEVELD